MKLVFKIDATTTRQVSPNAWTGGDKKGQFRDNGALEEQNQVLTITFRPVIYIKQGLSAAERMSVLQHEKRHDADFRRLAGALKRSLELKIRAKIDPEAGKRWDWFHYDLCVAANNFHRQEMKAGASGNWMEICEMPSKPRPT